MKLVWKESKFVRTSDADFMGRFRTAQLLGALNDAAGLHAAHLHGGYEALHDKGVAWILARFRMRVFRYPAIEETVEIATWAGRPMKWLYPRYYTVTGAGGEVCAAASSFWMLADVAARRPVAPAAYGVDGGYAELEPPLPPPGRPEMPGQMPGRALRTATVSDLDVNRHVNNARYAAWALDLLDPEIFKDNVVSDITLNYVHEIGMGTEVELQFVREKDRFFVRFADAREGRLLCEAEGTLQRA